MHETSPVAPVCEEKFKGSHSHDESVKSVGLESDEPVNLDASPLTEEKTTGASILVTLLAASL
jgi:hypothetical protein